MKVRGCEGEETNYFRSFALSPFMFAEQVFFLGEGGVPNDYCICQGGVGRVRGIFLVILLCEIYNIEISRGGGSGVQFI